MPALSLHADNEGGGAEDPGSLTDYVEERQPLGATSDLPWATATNLPGFKQLVPGPLHTFALGSPSGSLATAPLEMYLLDRRSLAFPTAQWVLSSSLPFLPLPHPYLLNCAQEFQILLSPLRRT